MKILNILKKSLQNDFDVLGINERNASLIYPNNKRKDYKLADDKVLTKNILEAYHIPCSKTYTVIENIGSIQEKWNDVQRQTKIAIKPANGSGGGGIKIIKKDKEGHWTSGGHRILKEEIFLHLSNIIMGRYSFGSTDRVLIEECIEPHSFFSEIYPQGVPDFRIILLKKKPLMAMLRVPTDKSDGKANLHQGGLGIGIDMKKGILTQAYDGVSYFDTHPDNGNQIVGKRIPYWESIVQISIQTAKHFPLNYLGVDIVIDKIHGPLIMEVNVRPGLGIQLANKTGLKFFLKTT
ncbi:sugar-transfer associated ATP-grasp domain-containing protein [Psychroserpens luteolus]|uniref:sugar-transfer associated ATP-grasp domain-containing protein n=1 Tax=Psychroserpens luteolus TaxID=2855840 RepID=UPI001E2E71EE|nr:sugar-transfer associated ATP-grasp domain-containing protein [Psychroserpens luteolus]MCD2258350.1 hypothetical protein [Psychroserpens luteolus]